ncbi:hypothetical protein ACF0H5_000525 [Mactra antiquata]
MTPTSKANWWKTISVAAVLVLFINEYLIYQIQSYRWPKFPSIDRKQGEYQVLLLVADPQLQGYQDEGIFPFGTLARWDIDRYLRNTFTRVYAYSQPDVVLFMGDLFDEGSKATTQEYIQTYSRFNHTFQETKYSKTIYIPGDNDIGGERSDFVTERKVQRFQKHFGDIMELVKYSFIDYIKLDLLTYALTEDKVESAEILKHQRTSQYTVLVNHQTVMLGPKHFSYPITKRLKPKIILSAHWHKAQVFTCHDCLIDDEFSWTINRQDITYIDSYHILDIKDKYSVVEISAPTCSYRMGVVDIGYPVVIIGTDGTLQFTILWTPRRYTMLLGYLIFIVIAVISYIMNFGLCKRR